MSNTELLGSNVSYERDPAPLTEQLRVPLSVMVESPPSLEDTLDVDALSVTGVDMNDERYPDCQANGKICTRVCSC